MLLRVALVGSGTLDDPYTVNLPTWRLLAADYRWLRAIVEVPDHDLPPKLRAVHPFGGVATLSAARSFVPTADHLEDWHAHLDARYVEHAGRFRPTIV